MRVFKRQTPRGTARSVNAPLMPVWLIRTVNARQITFVLLLEESFNSEYGYEMSHSLALIV